MEPIDFNEISAAQTKDSEIETIYLGTDLVWTSKPAKLELKRVDEQSFYYYDEPVPDRTDYFLFNSDGSPASRYSAEFSELTDLIGIVDRFSTGRDVEGADITVIMNIQDCVNLASAEFPKANVIWQNCFAGCGGLSFVSVPSAKYVGTRAFYGCGSLKDIELNRLLSVENHAFSQSGIESLRLPAVVSFGIQEMPDLTGLTCDVLNEMQGSLCGCQNLNSIELPSVTRLSAGSYALGCGFFEGLPLEKAQFAYLKEAGERAFAGSSVKTVSLPALEIVDSYFFTGCEYLSSVYLPAAQEIRDNAFNACVGLSIIQLESAISVAQTAFSGCSSLMEIRIPELERVLPNTFQKFDSLRTVESPKLKYVGEEAFKQCSALTSVNLHAAERIDDYAFYNCLSLSVSGEFENLLSVGIGAFDRCASVDITRLSNTEYAPKLDSFNIIKPNHPVYYVNETAYHDALSFDGWKDIAHKVILDSEKDRKIRYCIKDRNAGNVVITQERTYDKTGLQFQFSTMSRTVNSPFSYVLDNWEKRTNYTVQPNDVIEFSDLCGQVSTTQNCFMRLYSISAISLPGLENCKVGSFVDLPSLYTLDVPRMRHAEYNSFFEANLCSLNFPALTSYDNAFFMLAESDNVLSEIKMDALSSFDGKSIFQTEGASNLTNVKHISFRSMSKEYLSENLNMVFLDPICYPTNCIVDVNDGTYQISDLIS